MSTHRNPLSRQRWQYLKSLRSTSRLVWNATGNKFGHGAQGTFCENRSARKEAMREHKTRGFA